MQDRFALTSPNAMMSRTMCSTELATTVPTRKMKEQPNDEPRRAFPVAVGGLDLRAYYAQGFDSIPRLREALR